MDNNVFQTELSPNAPLDKQPPLGLQVGLIRGEPVRLNLWPRNKASYHLTSKVKFFVIDQ